MLTYDVLAATDDPDQLLGVYTAEPGTPSTAALVELAVAHYRARWLDVGHQRRRNCRYRAFCQRSQYSAKFNVGWLPFRQIRSQRMSSVKRILRTVAITGAIAALISGTLSSPASAANVVDCGDRTDVVHIWAHAAHHQDDRYELCAANAGFVGYQYWTDEFYTGNNRVTIHDMNGATFTLEKWTDYHPTNAFALDYFIIL